MTYILKNNKQLIIFFFTMSIFLMLSLTTCKKYPEDKFISLRKPTKRINGSWKIKEYTFNGNDVIDIINTQTKTFDVRDLVLEIIMKDPYGYNDEPRYRFSPYNYLEIDGGSAFVIKNDKYNHFYFSRSLNTPRRGDSLCQYVYITPLTYKKKQYNSVEWDIKHLYLSNMHLQLKTDSGNYDIYFKKQ